MQHFLEILFNWAVDKLREIINAFGWAIQIVGEILIKLIDKIGNWFETIFH